MIVEKTPIPQMEPWEGEGSGGEAPVAASPPRDHLLDRVYSDSEEEREYQVKHNISYNSLSFRAINDLWLEPKTGYLLCLLFVLSFRYFVIFP